MNESAKKYKFYSSELKQDLLKVAKTLQGVARMRHLEFGRKSYFIAKKNNLNKNKSK